MSERTVFAHQTCLSCGWFSHSRVEMVAYLHHATATFLQRRGYPDPFGELYIDGEWDVSVESTDPWRVEVSIGVDGDRLRHVVDGDLRVIEWEIVD